MYRVGVATYRPIIEGIMDYKRDSVNWSISYVDFYASYNLKVIKDLRLDGFIGVFHSQNQVDALRELEIPLVNTAPFELDGATTVALDEKLIGEMAADYFLSQQSANYYVAGHPHMFTTDKRLVAFQHELKRTGYKVGTINCQPARKDIIIEGSPYDPEIISSRLTELKLPASVLCHNDCIAFDLLEACLIAGLKVPDDVSILGVDNNSVFCYMTNPELSSVDPNYRKNGYIAAEKLNQLMTGTKNSTETVLIEPSGIIERASTDRRFLEFPEVRRALTFINANFNKGINVHDVVDTVALSRRPLEVQFRKTMDRTILEVITACRVEKAIELLKSTEWTVDRISHAAGFPNSKSMQKQIKLFKGCTAAQFRG